MKTHVVLENGNCVFCNTRLLNALRQRRRVQRVYTDFSAGSLVIEHEDDPEALLSLLTSDGRAVALASNSERVMVRLDAHETGQCPVARSTVGEARWDTELVRVSAPTSGVLDVVDECGNESFPASDPPQWWSRDDPKSVGGRRRPGPWSEQEAGAVQEEGLSSGRFEELGIDAKDARDWSVVGFGPFEAALAHGDGFTPSIIEHYRHQLERIARSWSEVGLDCAEGLRWHRAGFAAKEAATWRAQGVDVETARSRRAGYVDSPRGAGSGERPTHRTS